MESFCLSFFEGMEKQLHDELPDAGAEDGDGTDHSHCLPLSPLSSLGSGDTARELCDATLCLHPITHGMSNELFRISCTLDGERMARAGPRHLPVLLRCRRQTPHIDLVRPFEVENKILQLLQSVGVGPRIYAVSSSSLQSGDHAQTQTQLCMRLEEFFPSFRPLRVFELEMHRRDLGCLLGSFHRSSSCALLPYLLQDRRETDMFFLRQWLRQVRENALGLAADDWQALDRHMARVLDRSLAMEAGPRLTARRVLCHGDFQELNILGRFEDSPRTGQQVHSGADFRIIDFEYCQAGPAGFDIANHFVEYAIDNVHSSGPVFCRSAFPSASSRQDFYSAYASSLSAIPGTADAGAGGDTDDLDEDVLDMVAMSHIQWAAWAYLKGYGAYAEERLRWHWDSVA